jgi:hypothetical protein
MKIAALCELAERPGPIASSGRRRKCGRRARSSGVNGCRSQTSAFAPLRGFIDELRSFLHRLRDLSRSFQDTLLDIRSAAEQRRAGHRFLDAQLFPQCNERAVGWCAERLGSYRLCGPARFSAPWPVGVIVVLAQRWRSCSCVTMQGQSGAAARMTARISAPFLAELDLDCGPLS